METYNKKNLTGKISKMDKQLHQLDTLVPNRILKDFLKEEMTLKKESLSKKLTHHVKRQRIFNQPKTQDPKVNSFSQYLSLNFL